ncbi:RNA polymerase sigma factor [Solirubrobacter phytolaccae]|uniref:RNA polymerase sigma factor n=1 Tax=Solirubrobacter phytolaccae TaxID=1404360 RepID=A0A9X3S5C1_9ACTN|nr:RNA polymerase sigma factor [Solirubrobacter phytolaccae]MDA0178744.1 RNA polymerase sigma factor [Solirubrobacter phytolaccae]
MRPRLRLLKRASDSLLVDAQEDPSAFSAFYDAYADRILRFLARRVLDPEVAFDLLSETFAKALERRLQFRGTSAAEEQGWLFAIARTELSHYWRSGRVERAALERFRITTPSLSTLEYDRIESLSGINALEEPLLAAMHGLPDEQRRAVELRVVEDLSYAELATTLGVSEPTARARVSRGLRALAIALPPPAHDDVVEDIA